ncbi:MAG: GSCFA domain-containing protein [Spirochaetales bacterium]|nr:GSCFA domain-containing protein [Spirochaetales bacterium]
MDSFTARSVTYVDTGKSPFPTGPEDSHFFLGSCFAENLFNYMNDRFLNCSSSPFGNIYNPLSLAASIEMLISGKPIPEDEIFENRGLWSHYSFDTSLSRSDRKAYLSAISDSLEEGRRQIRSCTRLYLTLGTAYVFRCKNSGDVVNNCHKLPSSEFTRDCASIPEMVKSLSSALAGILKINPDLKIIITLSPVRHLRDNPVENSLSKARLRCLIDELQEKFDFWYFPSYEIILDQLRDYRWFAADMTHPSPQASDYIMERFFEASATAETRELLKDMNNLKRRLTHRILHKETEEAQNFLISTGKAIEDYLKKYPFLPRLKEVLRSYENGT